MSQSFIYVVTYVIISFLFKTRWYFITCMCHIVFPFGWWWTLGLLLHFSYDEQYCFEFRSKKNSLKTYFQLFWFITRYIIVGNSMLFFKNNYIAFHCTPHCHQQYTGFQIFHILINTCSSLGFFYILGVMRVTEWYLVVVDSHLFNWNSVEHLLIYLLVIFVSFLEKRLFKLFPIY